MKKVARQFGGDPSSAVWRHFARLAGLTNPKPSRPVKPAMETKRDNRVSSRQGCFALDQLEAMGCERFDIEVKRINGATILRERWSAR